VSRDELKPFVDRGEIEIDFSAEYFTLFGCDLAFEALFNALGTAVI
jgi:hypothetical protein